MRVDRDWKWKRAVFTVPASISHERVLDEGYRYRNYFGNALEREGFTVLDGMRGPVLAKDQDILCDPDRRKYHIFARVTRSNLLVMRQDVPDAAVGKFQTLGWQPV